MSPGRSAARGCGGWRATTRAWCPTRHRSGSPSSPGRHALVPALLDGVVPASRVERGAGAERVRDRGRAPPHRRDRLRPGRHPGPSAHGELGPRGRLGHHRTEDAVHDRRRAPQARVALRPFRRLSRGPRHGGPAAQRRCRVRDPGQAAARRRTDLPGRRTGPLRLGRRGRVLRRGDPDARGTGSARPADRRDPPARDALVRRLARDAGAGASAGRGPRVRYPCREDVCHDTGVGRRLRRRDRRPPGGLAHVAAFVAQGPRRREGSPRGSGTQDPEKRTP